MKAKAPNAAPDPIDIAVGARLRARRKNMGVTQAGLAEALSLSFQQVQKYERGHNRVSASVLVRCARALECTVGDLVGETEGSMPAFDAGIGARISDTERAEFLNAFVAVSPDERRVVLRLIASIAGTPRGSGAPGPD